MGLGTSPIDECYRIDSSLARGAKPCGRWLVTQSAKGVVDAQGGDSAHTFTAFPVAIASSRACAARNWKAVGPVA